jgi:hypothetical protein
MTTATSYAEAKQEYDGAYAVARMMATAAMKELGPHATVAEQETARSAMIAREMDTPHLRALATILDRAERSPKIRD